MYTINQNTIMQTDVFKTLTTGQLTDVRVKILKQMVADYYNTSIYDLDTFYKDGDDKLMMCFLLHDVLEYSVGSIASKFKINALYLHKNIHQYYAKALQDRVFFAELMKIKNQYKKIITTSVTYNEI